MVREKNMNEIEKLKQLVLQAKELSEPMHYFFDLTDAEAFSKMAGHRSVEKITQHQELMAVVDTVHQISNEKLGKSIKRLIPLFHELPAYHFFHGTCLSPDLFMPLIVIYFADVKTGIFAATGSKIDMIRFSLMKSSDMKDIH
jgi:hypothetical protein